VLLLLQEVFAETLSAPFNAELDRAHGALDVVIGQRTNANRRFILLRQTFELLVVHVLFDLEAVAAPLRLRHLGLDRSRPQFNLRLHAFVLVRQH